MRRLFASLLLVLPLSLAAQVRTYYTARALPGLRVALADTPGGPETLVVRLPLALPPTAEAQDMAQRDLEAYVSRQLCVACTFVPEQSGGYSDLWILSSADGRWRPKTRITVGGGLVADGLVRRPSGMGQPLQDVYQQAYVDAVGYNTGWFAKLGPDGGAAAWIVPEGEMAEFFELKQQITAFQAQQGRSAAPAAQGGGQDHVVLPDDPTRMSPEQIREREARTLAERGMEWDPKFPLRIRKIGTE